LHGSIINFTPAFHEKVKVQLPAKADMCFDKVNNDNLYNYNYTNESRPSHV